MQLVVPPSQRGVREPLSSHIKALNPPSLRVTPDIRMVASDERSMGGLDRLGGRGEMDLQLAVQVEVGNAGTHSNLASRTSRPPPILSRGCGGSTPTRVFSAPRKRTMTRPPSDVIVVSSTGRRAAVGGPSGR